MYILAIPRQYNINMEWHVNQSKTIFAQLMEHLPIHDFRKCVRRYQGNRYVKSFSCYDQFLSMAFAQLTYRESLRDITTCLQSMKPKLYHCGFRGNVKRSTLSDANEKRDYRIYHDFAQHLIGIARSLYRDEPFIVELDETVYAFDSTTIDLCLSLFPWASFRKNKGAIKMHTLFDLKATIPSFLLISEGKMHDVNALDFLFIEAGAFYILDRGYIDYERLYSLHQNKAYFVTRAKTNLDFRRLYSYNVDKATGLRCDQTILLKGFYTSKDYPEKLRRIKFFDETNNRSLVFLTNNFTIASLSVAQLYKSRWQIELFFKWMKQHLRIKAFYGTSENAVKTQIWIAICVYLIVAILKKRLNINASLYTILQILSVSLFENVVIKQLLTENNYKNLDKLSGNQLFLFDF